MLPSQNIHSILLVDDDPSIHDQAQIHFGNSNYKLIHAEDGKEAVQIAIDSLPDVVVCDVNMPGYGGMQVFAALRENSQTHSIPCILISGEYLQEAGLAGVDAHLVKPFTMEELEQAVNSQINRYQKIEEKYGSTLSVLRTNIAYALPHELRTPLSHIWGYAELITLDAEDIGHEDIREHAESIIGATNRLHHLVENYLAYAQLQLIEANPTQRAGLRNTIIKTEHKIEDETGAIAVKYDRFTDLKLDLQHTAIRITEDNFRKIVYELVDNAFKFSDAGTPIYVKTGLKDGTYILQIQDFGRGMSSRQIDRIGAYMQFDRKVHEQQGAGLGLALVRQLVRMHDGYMQIKSEVDGGTIIRVNLPQTD